MTEQTKIKTFSEVYPPAPQFEAEQKQFKEIIGKDIIVKDLAELTGEYGSFIVVLAELSGKDIQFASGSSVVMPKLLKAKKDNNLPIKLKIVEKRSEKSKMDYFTIE